MGFRSVYRAVRVKVAKKYVMVCIVVILCLYSYGMNGRHTFLGGVTRQQTANILHKRIPISDQPIFRTHTHTIAVRCFFFFRMLLYTKLMALCSVIFIIIKFV